MSTPSKISMKKFKRQWSPMRKAKYRNLPKRHLREHQYLERGHLANSQLHPISPQSTKGKISLLELQTNEKFSKLMEDVKEHIKEEVRKGKQQIECDINVSFPFLEDNLRSKTEMINKTQQNLSSYNKLWEIVTESLRYQNMQ